MRKIKHKPYLFIILQILNGLEIFRKTTGRQRKEASWGRYWHRNVKDPQCSSGYNNSHRFSKSGSDDAIGHGAKVHKPSRYGNFASEMYPFDARYMYTTLATARQFFEVEADMASGWQIRLQMHPAHSM